MNSKLNAMGNCDKKNNERFLVVLIDRKRGRIYRYEQPENKLIVLEELYDDVPPQVKSASWKGLADDKVARHIESHVLEHLKKINSFLEKIDCREQPDHILIGGSDDVTAEFRKMLSDAIGAKVSEVFRPPNRAGLNELTDLVCAAIEKTQITDSSELIAQIESNREPNGRAVIGLEPVIEALTLKQVQMLVLDESSKYPGSFCQTDGIVSSYLSTCPVCSGSMDTVSDLKSNLIQSADAQAAQVVTLDSSSLKPYGGIVALKRFTG